MTDRNEEKLTNGDDKAMRFTRTTSYANSKVLTSSSKAVIKYRKKKSPRKITPTKSIITKNSPAYPSIRKYLVSRATTQGIVPFRVSSKSDAYKSKYPDYPSSEDDPLPGDLVMASAGDIGLKEYEKGELKRNELVFGIAKSFTYVNHMFNYSDERSNFMVKDLELLKVEWSIKPGKTTTKPIDMKRMYAKVVAKKNDPDMLEVNDFLKLEARRHFYFGLPEGWMGVDLVMKDEAVEEKVSV